MLYYLLVSVYVLVCLLLIVVILLQQGKGGDIASAFGGGSSQAAFGARAGATRPDQGDGRPRGGVYRAVADPVGLGTARRKFGRRRHCGSGSGDTRAGGAGEPDGHDAGTRGCAAGHACGDAGEQDAVTASRTAPDLPRHLTFFAEVAELADAPA